MDLPSGSRPLNTNDTDFSDRIRTLLGYKSDTGSSSSEADNSDADWNLCEDECGPM